MSKIIQVYCLAILLLFSCSGQPERSPSAGPGTSDNDLLADKVSEPTRAEINTEHYYPETGDTEDRLKGSGGLALNARIILLNIASTSWLLNNFGMAERELAKVSAKGLLPFWVRDPLTEDPVRILLEQLTSDNEIAYWLVPGAGWDFSVGADPKRIENSSSQFNTYIHWASNPELSAEASNEPLLTDWGIMTWTFREFCNWIMETYLNDHNSMPSNLSEFLGPHYFLNEDFLIRTGNFIDGNSDISFEFGVLLNMNVIYFEYSRSDGSIKSEVFKYEIGVDGYNQSDPERMHIIPGSNLPETAIRVPFLTKDMIINYESRLPEGSFEPLSAFYE